MLRQHKKFLRFTPHLPVKHLQDTLDYYRERLGFYGEWIWEEKDGGIGRGDLKLLFMEDPAHAAIINTPEHRMPILWFVEDIREVYAELVANGIEMAHPVRLQPFNLWQFDFIDINGYMIQVVEEGYTI